MGNASKANSGIVAHISGYHQKLLAVFLLFVSSLSVVAQNKVKTTAETKVDFYLQQKSDSVFPYLERLFKKANIENNRHQMFEIYRWQLKAIDKLNRLNYMSAVVQKADSVVMKQANRDQIVELERLKGRIFWRMRHFEKARQSFFILLAHSQKSYDSVTMAVAFNNLGLLYSEQAMADSAMSMFQKALDINKKLKNTEEIASTLNLIGNAYLRCNKYNDAKDYYLAALLNARNSKNPEIQAKILINLSKVSHKKGKINEALQYIDSASSLWMQTKNNHQLAAMLIEKGTIYSTMNQYGTALENYRKALEIRKRLGDRLQIAATFVNIGTIYKELNMSEIAINYYNQALDIYKELKNDQYIATTLNYLGGVYYKTGNFDRALDYYLSSFRYFEIVNDKFEQANLYINIALMYKNLGNVQQSLLHYQKALEIFQAIDDQKRTADVLGFIGNLYLASNRLQLAENHFLKSLQIRQRINDHAGLFISKYDFSMLELRRNNYPQAKKYLNALWHAYSKLPSLEFKMNVALQLVSIHEKQQQFDSALIYHKQWAALNDSLVTLKLIEQTTELKYRTEVEKIRIDDQESHTSDNRRKNIDDQNGIETEQQFWNWLEYPTVAIATLLVIISIMVFVVLNRSLITKRRRSSITERLNLTSVNDQSHKPLSQGEIAHTLLEINRPLILDLWRETQIALKKNSGVNPIQQLNIYNDTLKLLAGSYDILEMDFGEKISQNRLENQVFDVRNLVEDIKAGYSLFTISRQITIQNMVDENTIVLGNPLFYHFIFMLWLDFMVETVKSDATIFIAHHKFEKFNCFSLASDKIYYSQNEVRNLKQSIQGNQSVDENVKTSVSLLISLVMHGAIHVEILKYHDFGTKIVVSTPDLLAGNLTNEQKTVN